MGTEGPSCIACALGQHGTTFLCVGLEYDAIPSALSQYGNHSLEAVVTSTLATRLDGSFYESPTAKEADQLPGEGGLSCLCVPFNTASVVETYSLLRAREAVQAHALPAPLRVVAASTPPPPPQPSSSSRLNRATISLILGGLYHLND